MNRFLYYDLEIFACIQIPTQIQINFTYTNLKSHMHPSVHTCLGLVLYISFQSPQYQFYQCLPKDIHDKFCTNYATMELRLFQPSWEKQVCKTEIISANKPC